MIRVKIRVIGGAAPDPAAKEGGELFRPWIQLAPHADSPPPPFQLLQSCASLSPPDSAADPVS